MAEFVKKKLNFSGEINTFARECKHSVRDRKVSQGNAIHLRENAKALQANAKALKCIIFPITMSPQGLNRIIHIYCIYFNVCFYLYALKT